MENPDLRSIMLGMGLFVSASLALDVSVTDSRYGAIGNGTTNDRAAIQAAIDAVAAAGGGAVTLPGGKTFLSGDLTLKSNVTFMIAQNAVLKQSTNPDHYAHRPSLGKWKSGDIPWNGWQNYNYPLIHALSGTKSVKVTGAGTITMSYTGNEGTTIYERSVGFFDVDSFEISDITITGGHSYHIYMGQCRNGLVRNVTVRDPIDALNNDGVSIMNSQHIRVTGCHLTCNDDLIYIWTSYRDPRKSWWNSDNPQPSCHIEIDHNALRDGGRTEPFHGLLFIAWGGTCPDLRQVEIYDVNMHDNDVVCQNPLSCIGPDAYYSGAAMPPAKDFTIRNNILTPKYGTYAVTLDNLPITNLNADLTAKRSESNFKNSGFENTATCYWSLVPNNAANSAGANNNSVGQSGTWYGYIDHLDQGDAKIFQGLYKTTGNYQFSARVQSSGATVRMFARDQNDNIIKCREFSNTSWSTVTMPFTVSTAGNVRLGIERGNATSGWARIDDVSLTTGGPGGTGCSNATSIAGNTAPGVHAAWRAGQIQTAVYDLRGCKLLAHTPTLGRGHRMNAPVGGCYLVQSIHEKRPFLAVSLTLGRM